MRSLFDIPITSLAGVRGTLAEYKGSVLLVVNVASLCGLTPQYTALESLYNRYEREGLVVLGFPANDFGAQEPGTDAEIATFCSTEYAVSFPMFSKIAVTGAEKHPLYRELTAARPDHMINSAAFREELQGYGLNPRPLPEILWNFEKFLVNREGRVLARFAPDMAPDDPRITNAIEDALR